MGCGGGSHRASRNDRTLTLSPPEVLMDSENRADESGRGHCLPRSLLVDHAAVLLGVSRRTVYNRIREGRLKTIRTPSGTQRVLRESLEACLRDSTRDAKRSGGGLVAMLV